MISTSSRSSRIVTAHCSWQRLLDADGDDLELTYRRTPADHEASARRASGSARSPTTI